MTCKGLDGVLYVGARGGGLQQWDLETHECLAINSGHTSAVRALAVFHKVPFRHSQVCSRAVRLLIGFRV